MSNLRQRLFPVLALIAIGCGGNITTAPPQTAASAPASASGAEQVRGDYAAVPGEPQPEPATLHSLAIRWPVKGDANRNARITVRYRKAGANDWKPALPLFRTTPAKLSRENRVAEGWLFAGSIVDLDAAAQYEVHLLLTDPEGGDTERNLFLHTLDEPKEPAGMRVLHVVPEDGAAGTGTRDDPFHGLRAAQAAAQPGDLFLLRPGVYMAGNWLLNRHGTAERPIIYRGAGDGEVILDGQRRDRLISANGLRHVWFENLTLRNARYLLVAHNGSNIVVRSCRFVVTEVGIAAINGDELDQRLHYDQSRHFVITDNVFTGPSSWPRSKGIESSHAVSVTGSGHVIAYNQISNVGDGVHGTMHGRLSASDIHNNEIFACTDDGIEADEGDTNVRIFRNRITNCFSGISAQPMNGGPLYVFRNALYNLQYSPFKLHNHTSGILLFHNTSVVRGFPFHIEPAGETVNDVITRNNLFVGTRGPALRSTGVMIRCDFDSDGYAGYNGPFALWNKRSYPSPQVAKNSTALYAGQGAFYIGLNGLFESGLSAPDDLRKNYPPRLNNPRLRQGSGAIDRGVPLANFNDGFSGAAPDLGCCELNAPLPHYGPRGQTYR
jgi:hypothetical protein